MGRSSWSAKIFGAFVIALSLLLGAMLLGHRFIPNRWYNLGSLVETFLPWFGLAIPVLVIVAAIRRKPIGIIASLLPALIWGKLYIALLPDKAEGPGEFRVVSHNVSVENADPEATVEALLAEGADVLALVEVSFEQSERYGGLLTEQYPYSAVYGTVELWSMHPIAASGDVELDLGWSRALRAEVDIDGEAVAFYVAHLPSVRVNAEGFTIDQRNRSAELLGEAMATEDLERVVLLGDLNGTLQDRSLVPLTYQLDSAHAVAGKGFGFTWPAGTPLARIDQVLFRGLTPTDSVVLDATGSDHRPVEADFDL